MAKIELKNEDFSLCVSHNVGAVSIELSANKIDDELKAAIDKIGAIRLTLDEINELITALKEQAKNSIERL